MKNIRIIITVIAAIFVLFLPVHVYASDKVVVVIDPGHGGPDIESDAENGAMYNDNLSEKTVNLVTALAMKEELESYNNVEVYLTRDTDRSISLEDRARYAKDLNADVMICCHYNASETHLFYGAEIFTSAFSQCYATGNGLAQCILGKWENDGAAIKGSKTRIGKTGKDYYGVIREGTRIGLPVIIIEHGYLDNHIDYARLGMEEDWKRMGRLDAQGVAEYYGLSKDAVLSEVIPTVHVDIPEGTVEPDLSPPTSVDFEIVDYDPVNSEVVYQISAIEPDGSLMYYGLALGEPDELEPSDYADLYLWTGEANTVSGNLSVPSTYRGKISARVYNSYELYSDCEPVMADMATRVEEYEEELRAIELEQAQESLSKDSISLWVDNDTAIDTSEEEEEFTFFLGGRKADGKTKTGSAREKALLILIISFVMVILIIGILIYIVFFKRR